MAGNKMICEKNNVDYVTIRKAMCNGARSVEDLKDSVNTCGECSGCKENLDKILSLACGCKQVQLKDVVEAVKNGADSVEKVGEATGAGTVCGRCQGLIQNIISLKR